MKKRVYFIGLGLAALMAACQPAQQATISGTLSGIESDTLLVRSILIGSRDGGQMDTVPMKDGKFAVQVNDSVVKRVFIFEKPSGNKAFSMQAIELYLLPGKPMTVNGSMKAYTLGGDAFYEACNQLNAELLPYMNSLDSLGSLCMQMERDGVPGDSVRRAYAPAREWLNAMQEVRCRFIQANADKDVAVYALSRDLSLENLGKMLDVVGESARNGAMAPVYANLKQSYERTMARDAAAERIKEGTEAPDFTLKDLQGKDFTLSSLRGKYVVLDFWGSWCGWCIKGIPDMKKSYEKHKAKVEFVGIDCNDTEEKWRKAVEEHQMPWLHVRNAGDPDVSTLYGIQGYPTKIVIDPEGKIAKVVVGEDPAFYKYLDSIEN